MIIDKTDSVGVGGTTTTGNSVRKCFFDSKNGQVLNDCVPLKSAQMESVTEMSL